MTLRHLLGALLIAFEAMVIGAIIISAILVVQMLIRDGVENGYSLIGAALLVVWTIEELRRYFIPAFRHDWTRFRSG
jgi:hypothetical protein